MADVGNILRPSGVRNESLAPPRYHYLGERTLTSRTLPLPTYLIQNYGYQAGAVVEMYWDTEHGRLVVPLQVGHCVFCGTRTRDRFMARWVCPLCRSDLARM